MANNEEECGLMSLFDWFANRRPPQSAKSVTLPMGYGISVRLVVFWHTKTSGLIRWCLECGYHVRVNSDERIHQLIDANTWIALDEI